MRDRSVFVTEQYTFTLQSNVNFSVKRVWPLWFFHFRPEKLVGGTLSCLPTEWNCKSLFILTAVQRWGDSQASGAHRSLLLCAATCKLLGSSKEGFRVVTTYAGEAGKYRCSAYFLLPAANSTWLFLFKGKEKSCYRWLLHLFQPKIRLEKDEAN